MKYIVAAVMIGVLAIAGYAVRADKKILSTLKLEALFSTQNTTSIQSNSKEATRSAIASNSGKVAGISTTNIQNVGRSVTEAGNVLGKSIAATFLSHTQQPAPIEIQAITKQIRTQVESIPSTFLEQAKVYYCQQVLLDATQSAKEKK